MSWKKIKLSEFLKNRDGRYKPNDISISDFKRIDKIDFSGNIFISDKASNTDMILVKKGDLVISGINIEKGAMTVYEGDNDITATIHYSSYIYDKEKIDIEFLKYFLKSSEFKQAIKEQVPGGIKTEIKPKHLLPLEVFIPTTIEEQKIVVENLKSIEKENLRLATEINTQLDLVKQLRQSFLREAMQGKLVSQNPADGNAKDLLEKIKAEKAKSGKKEKPLPAIKDEEIPFEIPENWKWGRLGKIALSCSTGPFGTMLHQSDYVTDGIPLVNPMNIVNGAIIASNKMQVSEITKQRLKSYVLRSGDVVIGRRGEMGRCAIVTENEAGWLCGTGSFFLRLHNNISRPYFIKVLSSNFSKSLLLESSVGATMNNLNHKILNNLPIPLPPLPEQQRIVEKLDELMRMCDELEQSIKASQGQNEKLLQQVLREALEK